MFNLNMLNDLIFFPEFPFGMRWLNVETVLFLIGLIVIMLAKLGKEN